MLCGDVSRRSRPWQLGLDSGDDDDPARAAREHVVQGAANAPEDVIQVDVERVLPGIVGQRSDRFGVAGAAGVQHHDVEAAVLAGCVVEQRFERILRRRDVGDRRRSLARVGLRDRRADPARRAGQHRDLSVELAHQ